jgi:hypothetical protein
LSTKNIYNTVWRIVHSDPNKRNPTIGEAVSANEPILLEHCATAHYLASDNIVYRNDFGSEFEVSVKSYASQNKSQALNLEKSGKITRENPTKL